jgi:mRNA interferase MazF
MTIINMKRWRGEVYWVNMDPAIGTEIKKTRPGVIVSNNAQNHTSKQVIIAPLTSAVHKVRHPIEVPVRIKDKDSKVLATQLRAVDCQRLGERLGRLSSEEIETLDQTLKLVLALT